MFLPRTKQEVSHDFFSQILQFCFTELLIDRNTLNEIVKKIQSPLLQPKNFEMSIDSCIHLASYLTGIIYTETSLLRSGEELLLSLFQFSCSDHSELEFLTDDTEWEVNTAWQDVIMTFSKHLPKENLRNLIGKFANLVEENFLKQFPTDGATNCLTETIVSFMRAIFSGQPYMLTEVFHLFFNRTFVPTWKNKIEELCLQGEYLTGNLTFQEGSFKKGSEDMTQEEILKYFIWSYIKISVLYSALDEDEEDTKEIIFVLDDHKKLVMELVYDITMCQSFLENYKIVKYYKNVSQYYDFIKEKTHLTLEKLQIDFDKDCTTRVQSNSGFWAKTLYVYNHEIFDNSPEEIFKKYFTDFTNLHLVQLYGRHVDFDHIQLTPWTINDVIILQNLAHCDEIDVQIAQVFEKIKKFRNEDIPKFLFEK